MHAETYELVWGESPNDPPSESDCVVRQRIGHLINGKDQRWTLNDPATMEKIVEAIKVSALPFLERVEDLCDVKRQLSSSNPTYPPESLYRTAVQHLCGEVEEARASVQQLLERTSGPWRDRILRMAANLT